MLTPQQKQMVDGLRREYVRDSLPMFALAPIGLVLLYGQPRDLRTSLGLLFMVAGIIGGVLTVAASFNLQRLAEAIAWEPPDDESGVEGAENARSLARLEHVLAEYPLAAAWLPKWVPVFVALLVLLGTVIAKL